MHISSTAVTKVYGKITRCWGEKKKMEEIHICKHSYKEKCKCSPDKQDVHWGWREEEGEEEQGSGQREDQHSAYFPFCELLCSADKVK